VGYCHSELRLTVVFLFNKVVRFVCSKLRKSNYDISIAAVIRAVEVYADLRESIMCSCTQHASFKYIQI